MQIIQIDDLHRHILYDDGDQSWEKLYTFGYVYHRIDGPAVIYTNGEQRLWFKNGQRCVVLTQKTLF